MAIVEVVLRQVAAAAAHLVGAQRGVEGHRAAAPGQGGLVAVVLVLELVPLLVIRDNLFLNVWMLLAPNDSVLAWQARA